MDKPRFIKLVKTSDMSHVYVRPEFITSFHEKSTFEQKVTCVNVKDDGMYAVYDSPQDILIMINKAYKD